MANLRYNPAEDFMTIKLTPEHEGYVRELLKAGRYPDESAVVQAALAALKLEDVVVPDIPGGVPWTPETLRAAVQVGAGQADRGEFVEGDAETVMRRVHQQLARERSQQDQKAG
jgi:putative addiction module CopG family antidote